MLQRCWIVAVLALAAVAAPAHAQVTLEWKFKEGEKFFLQTVTTLHQGMKVNGKDLRRDDEVTLLFSVVVQKVNPDRSAVLEQKVTEVAVRNRGGPTAGPPAEDKFNQQIRGVAFHLTVTPQGTVTRVDDVEGLLKRLAGEDAGARKLLQPVLTEDYLKQSASEVYGVLPPRPVKGGDSWGDDQKHTIPLGPLGGLTTTRKYTYDGKDVLGDRTFDKISFEVTGSTYNPPKSGEVGGFPLQLKEGSLKLEDAKGTAWFDTTLGRLVRVDTTAHLKGSLKTVISGNTIETQLDQERTTRTLLLLEAPPTEK